MIESFTWIKQSAFRWRGEGRTVYIDPWGVTSEDPADLVLITHAHDDHFSMEDIERIQQGETKLVAPRDVAEKLSGDVTPVRPGDSIEVAGVRITAVPAYNVVEERLEMHPKANEWVGYVLTLGDHTYYHAGDTDHAPELSDVRADVAFLPIGGTYTMDAEEAGGLAKAMAPRLAVPMHFGFLFEDEPIGFPADADRFAAAADPIPVRTMTPEHPFETGEPGG